MKLHSELKKFSPLEQARLSNLMRDMEYSYKLKLLSVIKKENITENNFKSTFLPIMIQALSDKKKIQVILSYTDSIGIPRALHPAYHEMIKRMARRNKIQDIEDLVKINNDLFLNKNFEPVKYNYPEEFDSLDNLKLTFSGNEYSVYLPKDSRDFLEASNELRTCISLYASAHLTSTFKFFIKKDDRYFSSAEFRQGEWIFYQSFNCQIKHEFQAYLTEALAPFKEQIINFKDISDE